MKSLIRKDCSLLFPSVASCVMGHCEWNSGFLPSPQTILVNVTTIYSLARQKQDLSLIFLYFSKSVCSAFLIYPKSNHLSLQQLLHRASHYFVQCSWPRNESSSFHSCFPLSLSFVEPLMVLSEAKIRSSHSLTTWEARSLLSELNTFQLHPN